MAEPQQPASIADERITTYNKRAQTVVVVLVGLIVVGLLIETFVQVFGQKAGTEKTPEPAPVVSEDPSKRRNPIAEFESQQRAEEETVMQQRKLKEKEGQRDELIKRLERQQSSDGLANSTGASPHTTPEQVHAQFNIDELRRALEARRGPLLRVAKMESVKPSANRSQPVVRDKVDFLDDQVARIDEVLNRRRASASNAQAAETQRTLLNDAISRAAARTAAQGLELEAPLPSRGAAEVVGETLSTRQMREPRAQGPREGELVIPTGTIMSATLDMDLESDYGGDWRGLVSRDVYDINKEFVVIPRGTKIVGQTMRVAAVNEPIQNRMGMTVRWAILPDGKRIDFSRTSGLDQAGVAALKDAVDYHILAQFLGVAAYGVLGLGPSFTVESGEPNSSRDIAARDVTGGLRSQGRLVANKYLSVVPTVTIRAGTPFKIFLQDDIYVRPWASIDDTIYRVGNDH